MILSLFSQFHHQIDSSLVLHHPLSDLKQNIEFFNPIMVATSPYLIHDCEGWLSRCTVYKHKLIDSIIPAFTNSCQQ